MQDLRQITIIGTGLLGASVGLGVRAAGFAGRVHGTARSRQTLDTATRLGAIDAGFHDFAEVPPVEGEHLVVVAVPVGRFGEVFRDLAGHQREGLFITDVGSTKLSVVEDARRYLKQPQHFVPAHPMAGSERSGPGAAQADLFRGRPCVICPAEDTDPRALAVVTSLWRTLGMALHTMSPREHDRNVAAISHLPHLVAVLLTQTAHDIGPLTLASSGFRDTSRLSLSNPSMRGDIIAANRQPIADALDRYAARLEALRRLVREGKDEELLALLTDTQHIRQAWADGAGMTHGDTVE